MRFPHNPFMAQPAIRKTLVSKDYLVSPLWPVNFMFVSLRMARSGWILQSSNLHSPERRPAVEIVPKELVPVLRLELIVKGLRIAIGDEHERCANRESAGKSKNALVSQR